MPLFDNKIIKIYGVHAGVPSSAIRQELVAMGEHWGGDWCDERFTVRI